MDIRSGVSLKGGTKSSLSGSSLLAKYESSVSGRTLIGSSFSQSDSSTKPSSLAGLRCSLISSDRHSTLKTGSGIGQKVAKPSSELKTGLHLGPKIGTTQGIPRSTKNLKSTLSPDLSMGLSSGTKLQTTSLLTSSSLSARPGSSRLTLGLGTIKAPKTELTSRLKLTTKPLVSEKIATQAKTKLQKDDKKKKGKKTAKKESALKDPTVWGEDISLPEYDLKRGHEERHYVVPKFVPPEKDERVLQLQKPLYDVHSMKRTLINAVSASLIRAPNFKQRQDPVRQDLTSMAESLAFYDGEFVLKLALYTRCELNIRTTGNFLLAFASYNKNCRPYLRKYFCAAVALPSDWIDVAEQYQAFYDKNINFGSLPAALRRVMTLKFPDFDKYQLAKYNKQSSSKKKPKKQKKKGEEGENDKEDADTGRKKKKMVRPPPEVIYMKGRSAFMKGRKAVSFGDFDVDSESSGSEADGGSDLEDNSEVVQRQISAYSEQSETEEERERLSFTLKQLIRKLHITEPVEHVMCLIGKRYPSTSEDFYLSRLPGTFEEERADKRMKLPTPETWETQVSMKGNKASTWEGLIDHKKLPFMAMLRNLRNMIKAGISSKHHTWVIKKLTDEGAVIHSKQFPFRFFSAYEVLVQLEHEYDRNQREIIEKAVAISEGAEAPTRGRGRGARGGSTRGRGGGRGGGKGGKKDPNKLPDEVQFDVPLLQRYRKALDTAVKIATVHNVKPIRGNTVIFCNLNHTMATPCTSARGLGRPRLVVEVGVLLGLMCKYSCEDCVFIVYGHKGRHQVELEKGTILDNMSRVLKLQTVVSGEIELDFSFDEDHLAKLEEVERRDVAKAAGQVEIDLQTMLKDRKQIDNLIILSGHRSPDSAETRILVPFLKKYRRLVNPELLYVNVDLGGASCGFDTEIHPGHENDIYIAGYSDQILRFIAERGDGGQLIHVEHIDQDARYKLHSLPQHLLQTEREHRETVAPPRPLPLTALTPRWRTARVFISSTFRDMHGERDLLTRFVFPELRARSQKHFVNVYEVDLRWGLTEEEAKSHKTLELCLSEVEKCQLFVGILGERYGWVPQKADIPDSPEFDWVRDYPAGASVTELEMYSAALCDQQAAQGKAFFYVRDNGFESNIPKAWREDFITEDEHSKGQLKALKDRIVNSGLETYNGYPCWWGGVLDGKPVVSGLEDFGNRVLNNLWLAIQRLYPDENEVLDEFSHEAAQHDAYVSAHQDQFVGRKSLLKASMQHLKDMSSGLLVLAGKPGTGKSALMASLVHEYVESKLCESGLHVLVHFLGAAPGSTNIVATLRRLCHELNTRFSLDMEVPHDYKNLVPKFEEMLEEAAKQCRTPLVIFMDGLDLLDDSNQARLVQWIPEKLPENVILVVSTQENTDSHKALMQRRPTVVQVGPLDMWDKAEVVRKTLATHRKQLDESPFNNQMKLLLSKKEATIPLYLSLACEELRVFGVFEKINSKLKTLSHTIPHLLQDVMKRLEEDHGRDLVAAALTLLACSRNGLMENELHALLSYHQLLTGQNYTIDIVQNIQLQPLDVLPQGVFARLLRAIRGFLRPLGAESAAHLSIANADISTAIRLRYLRSITAFEQEVTFHHLLAGYFKTQADIKGDGTWEGQDARAFSELPYHIVCGGCYKELEDTLCNLHFIQKKCQLGMASQLLEDFQARGQTTKTAERERNKFLAKSRVQGYLKFISRNVHILASHPALTWQQAVNEASDSAPARDVQTLLEDNSLSRDINLMKWINKPATSDPCVYSISNMPQVVTCVAISPDSRQFACGSRDCVVRLYELDTGKEIRTFTGHSNKITDVCFAGTTRLCSASSDNLASLWDVQGGHRVSVLKGHTRQVNSVTADRQGKIIVSAGWDCFLKVWEAKDGNLKCTLKGEQKPVNCVSFHPEGQLIVTGSWDSAIRIWDTFHQTRKAVLRGHTSSVRDVAFSPSARHIASASLDGELKLWSATTGAQVGDFRGHALPINKLTFSPAGHELVTVSDDHKVKVWSGHLGKPLACLGEEEDGPAMSVAIQPEGQFVAVGYHSGSVRVYDIMSGLQEFEVKPHSASVRCIQYSSQKSQNSFDEDSDTWLLTGSDDCSVKLIDADNGKVFATLVGHTKPVMSVLLGMFYIVSTSEDFTACVYLKPESCSKKKRVEAEYILKGHGGPVTSCAMNSDSTVLVTGSRDMSLMFWDMTTLRSSSTKEITPARTLHDCHSDWINSVAWSNTGDYVVTASNDFNLKLWDLKSGKEKTKFTGHMSAVGSVGYSHGCIVSSSFDGMVKVWSHKGSEITTLHGHSQGVNCCDILVKVKEQVRQEADDWATMTEEAEWQTEHDKSKLEKREVKVEDVLVASCSDDGTIRLWQPLQGNQLATLTGHSDRVVSVATANGGTISSSSLDRSLKLWKPELDADKGVAMATAGSHDAEVTCVASSDEEGLVLTSSRDGCVKVWEYSHENSGPALVCRRSFKAHSESVNAVCFAGRQTFATGSNDTTICLWRIVYSNRGLVIKKLVVIKGESPVLTMSYCEVKGQSLLYSGHMDRGRRRLWNLKTGQRMNYQDVHTDWILTSTVTGEGRAARIVTAGMDQVISMPKVKTHEDLQWASVRYTGYDDLPPEKRQKNWITALTATSQGVVAGDVHGQLSSITVAGDVLFTRKLHAAGITSCVQIAGVTFTASLDKTIKVWDSHSFEQIGQFFCQSPVTSMTSIVADRQRHLVCGDKLGEISVLEWRGGTSM